MEDWEGWRTLLHVVRCGTVADAARALGVDPTTAGRRVRRLETRLACRLVERRGGRLEPTPACAELVPWLEQAEAALLLAGGAAGPEDGAVGWRRIRVTAVPFLCDHLLAPNIGRLSAKHPRLGIELVSEDRNLSLTRREADLALRLGPPAGPSLGAQQVGVLASATYARADTDPDNLPWAGLDAALAHLPEARYAERAAGRAGIRYRASRVETLCALTLAGAARAVLPHLVGNRHPTLVRVGNRAVVSRPLWLIGHPGERAPHVVEVASWIAALVDGMEAPEPSDIQTPKKP